MEITYDYYRIFYYVAKYKSFTQAANVLMSSQPNITRSMNNLESQLGCKLFVRSNRGVSLTPEGEKLSRHVSIAFNHLKNAELELADDRSLNKGIINIAASETALHGLLLQLLKKFHKSYPNIRLKISNHSTPQAVEAVKNGLADFAFVTTPTDIAKPLKEIPIKSFNEILVCNNAYSFLAQSTQNLADIKKYPLICLAPNTKTYELYSEFFKKHNLTLDPDIEVATVDQIIPMIKNDLGIGFVPEHIAYDSLKSGELFKITLKEKIPQRFITLVEDTSHPLSITASKFKEIIFLDTSKI